MNSVILRGDEDVLSKIRNLPATVDGREVFVEVAEIFAARLRAATPKGYSGRLQDSVVHLADDESAIVGFSKGVETAGNPDLDSVTKPRTRGRSVLKWVSTDELAAVLEETFDAYAAEGVTFMETRFVEQINGRA